MLPRVRLISFAVIAVALSCLQHGRLAWWGLAPDLPLALAAWSMVDGDDDGVVLRPWLVGLCRDLIAPGMGSGGGCYYTIAYGCLGLCFLPLRSWLFRSRAIAWGGWAFICSVVLTLIDSRLGGVSVTTVGTVLVPALTAGAAMLIGWLLGGLPPWLRPLRAGGA
jgi:hypothetical protein